MGISTSGGMIVGECVSSVKLNIPDDYEWGEWEWCEDQELEIMSPYFDAPFEDCIVGFTINDVLVSDIKSGGSWLFDVQDKANKFKEMFNVNPRLIGTQDVT